MYCSGLSKRRLPALPPTRDTRHATQLLSVLLCVSLVASFAFADRSEPIAEAAIQKLEEALAETVDIESTIERRRALKRVMRNASSILDKEATAPNRFLVLNLLFRTQMELVVLRNDERNREGLLDTCRKLVEAPYEYAAERLHADVLLMRRELELDGSTEHEQAVAVADLADRYRGTPGEIDSLIIASELAFNLGEAQLLRAFRGTLATKFRESTKAIGFLKDRFASKSSSLLFRGRFKRVDGEEIVLPIDRAGHVYLVCFWSARLNDLKERLLPIKELQKKYAGKFEVLSFNLDELPDAGKSTLDALGLDWAPLHLPGGSNNELFRACGTDPQFLIRIVNGHGYIILTPIDPNPNRFGRRFGVEEYLNITRDKAPFLSMVQSFRIGDFLIGKSIPSSCNLPSNTVSRIEECFIKPPMRYRLGTGEAMTWYRRAATRCSEVPVDHPRAKELWRISNRRIIALLGMWNLSGEPKYLREAVVISRAALKKKIPREAQIVPRFCLAKEALRQKDADAGVILQEFMKAVGVDKALAPERSAHGAGQARPLAVAAAAVLSLDAGSPVLFEGYRETLLDEHLDEPQLWPLTAYFFNKFMMGRIFRGNYHGSHMRVYHGFRSWQQDTELRPRKFLMKLKSLNGTPVEFPHRDREKSNVIVFMEPPVDETSAAVQVEFVKRLEAMNKAHYHTNLHFVAAFVSGSTNEVHALVRKNGWNRNRIAIVPDGLKNPHVVRLGIFLADERPNTFTVAPDGTITWSMSGMYQMAVGANGVTGTVGEKIRAHDIGVGQSALEDGDFAKALRFLNGSFKPDRFHPAPNKYVQVVGRAKAHAGLGSWQSALQELDGIVSGHTQGAVKKPCACHALSRKLRARAGILEKLEKKAEAAADLKRADVLSCPRGAKLGFNPDRYEQEFFGKLARFAASEAWGTAYEYVDGIIAQAKDGRQVERETFAGILKERAEVLAHLGEKEKADQDSLWANALTKGIEPDASDDEDRRRERRYVDVVGQR